MRLDYKTLPGRKVALFGVFGLITMVTVYNISVMRTDDICVSCLFNRDESTTYVRRRGTLLEACEGKISEYRGRTDIAAHLTLDDNHRLIYCPIAKVSSSFWKRVMQVSSGVKTGLSPFDIQGAHDSSLRTLRELSFSRAHWTLKNYTSFLFVREPYSRLLACYNDKFFTTNPTYWNIGKMIVRRYRKNPTSKSLSCGHDVTFPEFIKHVIDTVEQRRGLDEHWMPMYMACAPCEIEYDVIGKLETISQDLDYILKTHIRNDVIFTDMESESEVSILVQNMRGLYNRYGARTQTCMAFSEALHRNLRKEQVRGILNKSVELPDRFNKSKPVSRQEVEKFILEKYREDGDKTLRKVNRKEALIEAYSQVPLEDMRKLQQLYKPDFDIFGYDPQPPELFGENIRNGKVKKFYFS